MDPAFTLLWQRYRGWASASKRLKANNTKWKRNVLLLTIVGTALAALAPFVRDAGIAGGWALPYAGSAALALATYFGKALLDTKHEETWARARAAAEAYKSEAAKYAVQAPPYATVDREAILRTRLEELATVGKGLMPDNVTGAEGMPSAFWTPDEYIKSRLDDQTTWYRQRAQEQTRAMTRGRAVSVLLGGVAVLLGLVSGTTPQGAKLVAAILGVVTTTAAAIGAHFQAGHLEAIALKYRETAATLDLLKLDLGRASTAEQRGELVVKAEAIMQAENAAWLIDVRPKVAPTV